MTREEATLLAYQQIENMKKDPGSYIGISELPHMSGDILRVEEVRTALNEASNTFVRVDCPVCKSSDHVRLSFFPGMKECSGVSCGACSIYVPPHVWALLHNKAGAP